MDKINRLNANDQNFMDLLKKALDRDSESDEKISESVASIIRDVKSRGDSAILEYTKRFDLYDVKTVASLEITDFKEALSNINKPFLNHLK